MNKLAIKTQAIITSISSKKDGSLGLRMNTPELDSQDKVAFMELQNINLEVYIKAADFVSKEVREVKGEMDGKTPSQRLRNTLFVLWDQEGRPGEYNSWYIKKMEKIINWVKSKLDEREN